MSVILLVLGILLVAAGGASIGLGILSKETPIGPTLILAGAFALVGGLLLVGLSAVIAELVRVAAALKASASKLSPAQVGIATPRERTEPPAAEIVAREPVKEADQVERRPEPLPVPTAAPTVPSSPAVEVSASAIERLRSSIPRPDKVVPEMEETVPLSPNGQYAPPVAPRLEPVPRSAGAAAVETREPKLDFLFRPRPVGRQGSPQQHSPQQHSPQQTPQQDAAFDSLWPKRSAQETQPAPKVDAHRAPLAAGPVQAAPASEGGEPAPSMPPAPRQPRTVAILKSGVVDGMAYTLYADGSIEAQLPQGTVRFGSIAELRAHIESNG